MEPRSEHGYVQLSQRFGDKMVTTGRSQDPFTKRAPERERHQYQMGMRSPPSYGEDADYFEPLGATVFEDIERTMLVDPTEMSTVPPPPPPPPPSKRSRRASSSPTDAEAMEHYQKRKATLANIIGISETRRDPAMGLFSAQAIHEATREGSTATPRSVFGHVEERVVKPRRRKAKKPKKKGELERMESSRRRKKKRVRKVSHPGTLVASGAGATAQFRALRSKIMAGEAVPKKHEEGFRRIRDSALKTSRRLAESGFDPKDVRRLQETRTPGGEYMFSDKEVEAGVRARMISAMTRRPSAMLGLSRYDLRPLTGPKRLTGVKREREPGTGVHSPEILAEAAPRPKKRRLAEPQQPIHPLPHPDEIRQPPSKTRRRKGRRGRS